MKTLTTALLAALIVVPALAITPAQVDVTAWVGSGSNQSFCVIDFGAGNTYAFGYRWESGATVERPVSDFSDIVGTTLSASRSEAMLLALSQSVPGLVVNYEYSASLGMKVGGFSYDGHSIAANVNTGSYMSMYLSGNAAYQQAIWGLVGGQYQVVGYNSIPGAAGNGENWLASDFGASSRELQNGWFDGWTQANWMSNSYPLPVVPTNLTAGDASGDGKVDFADYLALESSYGMAGTWSKGDFTRDNKIDFADYLLLEAHFGEGSTTVPEPATLSLLMLAGLVLAKRNRRQMR